jgi:hypothetical protein
MLAQVMGNDDSEWVTATHWLAILGVMIAGCSTAKPAEPLAGRPESAAVPAGSAAPAKQAAMPAPAWQAAWGPPPPEGVMVPRIGRVIRAEDGRPVRAAYVWKGAFEVDPAEPEVAARVREETAQFGSPSALGEIGKQLYLQHVIAAGIETSYDGYNIQNDALYVHVVGSLDSDRDAVFELFVGPPGG